MTLLPTAATETLAVPSSTGGSVATATTIDRLADLRLLALAAPSAGPSGDPAGSPPQGSEAVEIISITDGDTLSVRLDSGTEDTVRLIGVNTPESGECLAGLAAEVLSVLVPNGSTASVTVDTSNRDQFDRLLRYLWTGSMSVNEELVRRGVAIARRYPPDIALADRLEAAQAAAHDSELGMWAPEACGPASSASLEIVALNYDPPGNDNDVPNEEWIRIQNTGSVPIDLTGWTIRDESASHRYPFPTGLTLTDGETVTIHSGCGDDFSTDLYWCNQGSVIWNNDGDTAFLVDPSGNIHDDFAYRPAATTTTTRATTTTAKATTTTTRVTTTTAVATTTTTVVRNCDPSYPDFCIPPPPPDLDCGDIGSKNFTVLAADPHGFDGDNDGLGCES
jgi:micrococcal nuclease